MCTIFIIKSSKFNKRKQNLNFRKILEQKAKLYEQISTGSELPGIIINYILILFG